MTCTDLATTGQPLPALLTLGVGCIIGGGLLLAGTRNSRGKTRAVLVVLLLVTIGLASAGTGPATAHASAPGCDTTATAPALPAGNPSLTIIQTSTNPGIAPGIAPTPITGLIINNGTDNIYITAGTVSIASVTTTPDPAPGNCDATDYTLNAPAMPVALTLQPGGSAPFAGAAIGFNNKTTNQDACKTAIVGLTYLSS